jgi:16S rRNA (cytidine1402-2'-O)-methyltransferase
LPSDQFFFGGFLSTNKNDKQKKLLLTKYNQMTGIWFDTCLRLLSTLKIMLKVYGNRNISIMRELTKTYEEVFLSDLENINYILLERIDKNIPLRGEIVIVIEGYKPDEDINLETIKKDIQQRLLEFSLRDTVNMIVAETGLSKKIVYNEAIEINNKKS